MNRSSTAPTKPGDVLERSQDMLRRSLNMVERSQAAIIRVGNTLPRLVEAQEELRQMVVALFNGRTNVPIETPPPTHPTLDVLKNEEEEEEEISRIGLSATTPAPPSVERDKEEEEISSVSSVSSVEEIDLQGADTMDADPCSANVPEKDEKVRPGYQLSTAKKFAVMEAESSGEEVAEESDGDEDDSEDYDIGSDEVDDEISDTEASKSEGSQEAASSTGANSEKLSMWKCAVCGQTIRGEWNNRQCHIYSHEGLKFSCPVAGCSAKVNHQVLNRHLAIHGRRRSSLPARTKAQLQRQQDRHSQVAVECERKYFPPSSLVSFVETSTRKEVEPSCKKCGKSYPAQNLRRDHVGVHLNIKMPCPFRGCKYAACALTVGKHISTTHGRTLSKLTEEERGQFEASRKTFYEKVDAVMGDYFSELLRKEEMRPACKKCGKIISKLQGRRDHVGAHLNATLLCPFVDCGYSGSEGTMLVHLHRKHGKNLHTLTKEQRSRFEESKKEFYDQVEAVMGKFFP